MKNKRKRKTTKLMKWIIAMGLTLTFNFAVFAQNTVYIEKLFNNEQLLSDSNIHEVYFTPFSIFRCDEYTAQYAYINGTPKNLEIISANLYGPDKDLFTYTTSPQIPAIVEPHNRIFIDITFNPTGATLGEKTAFLDLIYTFNDKPTIVRYKLIAEILEGVIATPNILDFGDIEVNKTYTENIKIENPALYPASPTTIKTGYLLHGTDFRLETYLTFAAYHIAKISVKSNAVGEIVDTLIVITEYKNCDDTLRIPIRANTVNNILENYVNDICIFPNPTSDYFTVNFELEKAGNMKIILRDILGKEIFEIFNGFVSEGFFTKTVKLSQLSKGIYYLQISDGTFSRIEKIFIN